MEKPEDLYITSGYVKCVAAVENSVWWFLKKLNIRIIILPSNFTLSYIPKRTENRESDISF